MSDSYSKTTKNPRRLILRAATKLMLVLSVISIALVLLYSLFARVGVDHGVGVYTLQDLAWGEARELEWQGHQLWLIKRRKEAVDALRDWDQRVKDPWSDAKPLPKDVNYLHRGLLSRYLLVFAQGQQCRVLPLTDGTGFYEPCASYRYDLAGRLIAETDSSGLGEHLRIPDYRIVGAQLIVGDVPR